MLNYPAEFDVYVDSNNDGADDYVLYNAELGGFAVTGQTVVYVADLATGASTAYFYVDGGFDSSTQIFTAPLAALGIAPGQTFSYSVYAFDNYFSGAVTDAIEGQSFTWGESKYTPSTGTVTVPAASALTVPVQATGSTATVDADRSAAAVPQRGDDRLRHRSAEVVGTRQPEGRAPRGARPSGSSSARLAAMNSRMPHSSHERAHRAEESGL